MKQIVRRYTDNIGVYMRLGNIMIYQIQYGICLCRLNVHELWDFIMVYVFPHNNILFNPLIFTCLIG